MKRLNAGDRAGAMVGMMDWRKPPEIIPRRTAERDLFQTGIYPDPYAIEYPVDHNGRVLWSKGKRVNVRELLRQSVAIPTPNTRPDAPAAETKPVPTASSGAKTLVAVIAATAAAVGAWFSDLFQGWF